MPIEARKENDKAIDFFARAHRGSHLPPAYQRQCAQSKLVWWATKENGHVFGGANKGGQPILCACPRINKGGIPTRGEGGFYPRIVVGWKRGTQTSFEKHDGGGVAAFSTWRSI